MTEVGFIDIVENRFKWPTNRWPKDERYKELGAWQNANMTNGLEGFTMAPLTRAYGWTKEEVTLFLVDVRKDLNNPRIHTYLPVYAFPHPYLFLPCADC